jgi:hypothetical protein
MMMMGMLLAQLAQSKLNHAPPVGMKDQDPKQGSVQVPAESIQKQGR